MDSGEELAFFDVETIIETEAIIEFGAIIVCPLTLTEKQYFSCLVRPQRLAELGGFRARANGLTREEVMASNTSFSDIASTVYDMLHGRIWVGHNIADFDREIIEDAFDDIGQTPPRPACVIDTLDMSESFKAKAGNAKMATLAEYFGLGDQTHRSLDDVRLNLRLFQRCAAILFLKSYMNLSSPRNSPGNNSSLTPFLDPKDISTASIRADPRCPFNRARLLAHEDLDLRIACERLRLRFGIDMRYYPTLRFVVDVPQELDSILNRCDQIVYELFEDTRSNSNWIYLVHRDNGNRPTMKLRIVNTENERTVICKGEASGTAERLVWNEQLLEALLTPGTVVDAYFSFRTYDWQGLAGIRLVTHKLIIHPQLSL